MIDVVAAVIREAGRILITQRHSHSHLPGMWEFPGGKVENGEPLQDALHREILEELGITIRIHDLLATVEHHYPSKSVRLHFFNCSLLAGTPRPLDVADVRWVLPADLAHFEFPEADRELISRLKSET